MTNIRKVRAAIERIKAADPEREFQEVAAIAERYRQGLVAAQDKHQSERIELAQEIDELEAVRTAFQCELDAAKMDTARLDWLQSQTKGYGGGWICRNSTGGRGMRLHETSGDQTRSTAREAIDYAMEQASKGAEVRP
jgi:hypothetical protein